MDNQLTLNSLLVLFCNNFWKLTAYFILSLFKNNDNDKKNCNMLVTMIPTVICALGTVTKRLVQGQGAWKLVNKKRPSKLQHCLDRLEY